MLVAVVALSTEISKFDFVFIYSIYSDGIFYLVLTASFARADGSLGGNLRAGTLPAY